MGRSPVFTISNSIRSASPRSAFNSMKPGAVRIAPGPVEDVEAMMTLLTRSADGW